MTEANELNWYFVEFLKTLIALSLPVEEQYEAYGEGKIGKEMFEELKANYSEFKEEYLKNGQLLEEHIQCIDQLETYMSNKENEFYEDPVQIDHNEEWEEVRKMAKNCIHLMEMDHLGLETTIVEEPSVDENGEEVIFQIIQNQIVDKSKQAD